MDNTVKKDETLVNEDELFYFIDNKSIVSEKITAPRYSYWRSVFRVFFRKKINIVILAVLFLIIFMSFIFPLFTTYAPTDYKSNPNLTILDTHHLSPFQAMKKFGFDIKWIFGTDELGDSIFF